MVEYAQTKQVVETVLALEKNSWSWAKDLKDGHYNVLVNEKDIHKLCFKFKGKIYIFFCVNQWVYHHPQTFLQNLSTS